MFCPYCGTKCGKDFIYCAKCGRKLPRLEEPEVDSRSAAGDSSAVVAAPESAATSDDEKKPGNRLESEFRALIKRMPSEALSHFKCVDKETWSIVREGSSVEGNLKTHGLVGPYEIKVCGIPYHAYAKEEGLAASQVRFLSIWSGGAKKGIRRLRKEHAANPNDMPRHFLSVVTFFVVLVGCLLAACALALRWGGQM